MSAFDDLATAQLLVSHLCHELVSPLGAVNNGVELIEEMGGLGEADEAVALVAQSGRAAIAKLRFHRLAYGAAGLASDFQLEEARAATVELFACEPRVALDWPEAATPPVAPAAAQAAMNLAALAAQALPRGGVVRARAAFAGRWVGFETIAAGPGARLVPAIAAALSETAPTLDHRTVHAYYTAWLARRLGAAVEARAGAEEVALGLRLPLAAG